MYVFSICVSICVSYFFSSVFVCFECGEPLSENFGSKCPYSKCRCPMFMRSVGLTLDLHNI